MTDFDALVLKQTMDVFAIPVVVTPIRSQPSAPAYANRGVWSYATIDVIADDGTKIPSVTISLGIRQSEYAVQPIVGDLIAAKGGNYRVDALRPDGQGGARLILMAMQAAQK